MDKKKLYILLKIACIVLLPIIFYSFASYRSKNRKIKEIQINYTNLVSNSHSFLEEKYIIQVLKIDNKRIQKVKIIIKE